jgi:hypothetical protein
MLDHNALRLKVKERPDLWDTMEDPYHPLNTAWPAFLDQRITYQTYCPKLIEYDELARYQFVITETLPDGPASVVACARSIPFFWPEIRQGEENRKSKISRAVLETLPDGGYDTIPSRDVRQYLTRARLSGAAVALTKDQEHDTPLCLRADPPNALSAISITVQPNRRLRGLAEALIGIMKATARKERLQLLVVPLRPTRKADFPPSPMHEYIKLCVEHLHTPSTLGSKPQDDNPRDGRACFDPWLRKHLLPGGQVIKVAPRSMTVQGSREDWKQWTGKDVFHHCSPEPEASAEVCFPGGLAPLTLDVNAETGVYMEPNVWLFHDLEDEQKTARGDYPIPFHQ